MILLIIKLLVLEVFICVNAWFDWLKIKDKWTLKHGIEGLSQLTFMTILAFGLNMKDAPEFHLDSIIEYLRYLVLSPGLKLLFFKLSLFWLQFDYVLNFLRNKDWWHLGNNIFDRILKGVNLRYWRLILKVVLVIGSLILLVL